jgi:hypothetical protein
MGFEIDREFLLRQAEKRRRLAAQPKRITKQLIIRRRAQLTREISDAINDILGKYDLNEVILRGDMKKYHTLLDDLIQHYRDQNLCAAIEVMQLNGEQN